VPTQRNRHQSYRFFSTVKNNGRSRVLLNLNSSRLIDNNEETTKKSNSDAEGDSLEKQYIIRRQQSLKQNKSTSSEPSQALSTSSLNVQTKDRKKLTNESFSDPCHEECSSDERKDTSDDETEHEKIERFRLKKRRKKELQKEKKRMAAERSLRWKWKLKRRIRRIKRIKIRRMGK